MASKAYTVLAETVISGDRVDDQRYLNLLSQLFTNLIVIREYANTATKVSGIYLCTLSKYSKVSFTI